MELSSFDHDLIVNLLERIRKDNETLKATYEGFTPLKWVLEETRDNDVAHLLSALDQSTICMPNDQTLLTLMTLVARCKKTDMTLLNRFFAQFVPHGGMWMYIVLPPSPNDPIKTPVLDTTI